MIRPYDRDALKRRFDAGVPYRHVVIESFLEPDVALEVADAYPSFEEAGAQGYEFKYVNERRKIQICDAGKFPAPIARLNAALASPAFLADLEYISGIPDLLADASLGGGGIHMTGPHGRLDVHVDFNFVAERGEHRRLNFLLYLNPRWDAAWGGAIELWDSKVKRRHHALAPILNRCLIFETSEISYHGVEPLVGPEDIVRKSFATYYYTKAAPPGWSGHHHGTIFQARPDERFRRYVLMPAERVKESGKNAIRALRRVIKNKG